jgi:hypothetical protein
MLRGTVTFMVRYGFSLSDLRQLYIDELLSFSEQLIILLEKEGILKPGTSEQFEEASPVDQLRRQIKQLRT